MATPCSISHHCQAEDISVESAWATGWPAKPSKANVISPRPQLPAPLGAYSPWKDAQRYWGLGKGASLKMPRWVEAGWGRVGQEVNLSSAGKLTRAGKETNTVTQFAPENQRLVTVEQGNIRH